MSASAPSGVSGFWADLRMLIYLLLPAAGLYGFIYLLADRPREEAAALMGFLFNEGGLVEWVQAGIGCLIAVLAACLAIVRRSSLYLLFAMLAMLAFVRELDSLLERILFKDADGYLLYLLFGVVLIVTWLVRKGLRRELPAFLRSRGVLLMIFGVVVMWPYGQILGQRHIWKTVARPYMVSEAKRTVEENLEFVGYTLILCGLLESGFFSNRRRLASVDADA